MVHESAVELIRQATPADVQALATLDEVSDEWPWPKASIAAACAGTAGQGVLVLESDGNIAAYVVFASILDEGSVHRVAVRAQYRQQGLGGRLLDAALLHLRELQVRRTVLELRRSNIAARALYCSRGFTVDGERKGYYPAAPNREDALLMSLSWMA